MEGVQCIVGPRMGLPSAETKKHIVLDVVSCCIEQPAHFSVVAFFLHSIWYLRNASRELDLRNVVTSH